MAFWDWRRKRTPAAAESGSVVAPDVNRRRAERYPCKYQQASFHLVALREMPELPTRIRDVSRGGIGLICAAPIPPGSFIIIQMDHSGREPTRLQARVVRNAPLESRTWLVGCVFVKDLGSDEFTLLRR